MNQPPSTSGVGRSTASAPFQPSICPKRPVPLLIAAARAQLADPSFSAQPRHYRGRVTHQSSSSEPTSSVPSSSASPPAPSPKANEPSSKSLPGAPSAASTSAPSIALAPKSTDRDNRPAGPKATHKARVSKKMANLFGPEGMELAFRPKEGIKLTQSKTICEIVKAEGVVGVNSSDIPSTNVRIRVPLLREIPEKTTIVWRCSLPETDQWDPEQVSLIGSVGDEVVSICSATTMEEYEQACAEIRKPRSGDLSLTAKWRIFVKALEIMARP